MKRILSLVLTLACASAWAQDISPNPNGGTPGGTAGGDLSGTYPNPSIKSSVTLTTPNIGAATGSSLNVGTGPLTGALPSSIFASLPSASSNTGVRYRVTDVGVNGSEWFSNGTKWAPVNGSVVLMQSGMPWIEISTGSISAGGALTGITALATAYPKAWIYLPANAVATVAAAGWYYCTFSTTTAGTVFLNQPSATFPIIWPASPTAVTDGRGSYTGVSASVVLLPNVTIPGNSMGINGRVTTAASVSMTSSANQKSPGVAMAGSGGTINYAQGAATAQVELFVTFQNQGNAALQSATLGGIANGAATNIKRGPAAYSNTANDTTLGMSLQNSTATENVVIENFVTTLYNDGQ